jgi:hypothetical protein
MQSVRDQVVFIAAENAESQGNNARGWAVSRVITVLSVGSFKMRKAGTMMGYK